MRVYFIIPFILLWAECSLKLFSISLYPYLLGWNQSFLDERWFLPVFDEVKQEEMENMQLLKQEKKKAKLITEWTDKRLIVWLNLWGERFTMKCRLLSVVKLAGLLLLHPLPGRHNMHKETFVFLLTNPHLIVNRCLVRNNETQDSNLLIKHRTASYRVGELVGDELPHQRDGRCPLLSNLRRQDTSGNVCLCVFST